MWDPQQYLRYPDERARPFFDLLARVRADSPGFVADLGCGPGNLTAALADRWPLARVLGVDSSQAMIGAAQAQAAKREKLVFELADITSWQPERPVDVLVSNSALQWVPGHFGLIRRWPAMLAPGGWLAFQLPANSGQPAHTALRKLARSHRWRPLLAGVSLTRQAHDPADYLGLLARAGCAVDAWETTYLHVLSGEDAIVDWYRGTGLRPVLTVLDPGQAEEFLNDYREELRAAYPPEPYGTVLPFRRVFVVARRA